MESSDTAIAVLSPRSTKISIMDGAKKNAKHGDSRSLGGYSIQSGASALSAVSSLSWDANPVCTVTAIFDYDARRDDELTLRRGALVTVISKDAKISGEGSA